MDIMQQMMQMSPGELLKSPAEYVSSPVAATWFTYWAGGFAVLALPWVFKRLLKDKDAIPLLMWVGGLICSLLEPMLDHLGHLWWSHNLPGPAFSGYDLNIPFLIPPCYVFFIAMTGYFAYHKMKGGLSVSGVLTVWFCISMTDVIMEIPGTSTGAYTYYGDVPFKVFGFPLAWGWLNGTSMLMVGFLLWLVAPYLKGAKKGLILLVPIVAMGAAYGMVAWPYFLALNWPMPIYEAYLWNIASLTLSVVVVRFIAAVVAAKFPVTSWQSSPIDALRGTTAAGR